MPKVWRALDMKSHTVYTVSVNMYENTHKSRPMGMYSV